ncbi:MAG TPA: SpoIID/LytB domain-containing protein [Acidimicrobiia bacterium]|nr:SpoIID/LytB domain-containing protein [Acidimicrobiia bacterium]
MLRPTNKKSLIVLAMVGMVLLTGTLPAFAADNQVTITGGGWGHGIGMPQYGAKKLGEGGLGAHQILQHYYTGASIGTVGQGALVGHASPLRIGVGQNMSRVDFTPVGGPLSLPGGLVAQPGQGWSLRVVGPGQCQYFLGEGAQAPPAPCSGAITWGNQPNVRVSVPTLNRTYARGKLVVVPAPNNTFHLLVEIGLEQYLYGLAEMPSSWHVEALKAQAIAGRTYALYKAWIYRSLSTNTARMAACGCHLYASTMDQKYIGWAKEAEGGGTWGARWRAAVDATNGQALVHSYSGGRALEAYYFSSSGGATENNEDQWGGSPYPYLRSTDDPGATSWTAGIPQSSFASALGFSSVISALITERYVSGSPKKIVVQGSSGGAPLTKTYTGTTFKNALGLRSHYVVNITGIVPFIIGADRTMLHDPSTGLWRFYDSAGTLGQFYFGNPGDYGFMGDWDCDGVDTPGLYRQSDGYAYLRNSNTQGVADVAFFFGNPGDVPMAGDFDGDGCDTLSIYRPAEGRFYIINELGEGDAGLGFAEYSYYFGNPGDAPFMGDWDGDGIDTPGLRRNSNGFVYLRHSNTQGNADIDYFYGDPGDIVFTGDWDNDGKDTLGLYRPSNGTVYLRNTNSTGIADFAYQMGGPSHRPVAGTP